MGLYVYAVGKAREGELPPLQGVLDRPAYRFEAEPLCAVVSECPLENVRAERRHIAATQRVLAALNAKFDLLPMAFGTVTKSEDDLRRFLDDNRDTLTSQLQRVSGTVEMGLRLSLEVPDPIAYLVERTPALKTARDRTFRNRRTPSYDDRIRLGQLVDAAFTKYREALTAQVLAVIGEFLRGNHRPAGSRGKADRQPRGSRGAGRSRSVRSRRQFFGGADRRRHRLQYLRSLAAT